MRITAGKHRGRKLVVPPGSDVRPTAERARQALFNIIEHGGFKPGGGSPLRDARVLDAFAGTGALGLEALSRGAAHVVFMENARLALDAIRHNVETCRETAHAYILRADATMPPAAGRSDARGACAIVFLDPPYNSALATPALIALANAGWLEDGAICCVELAAAEPFTPPEGFEGLDERRYGAARVVLVRYGDG